MSTDRLTSDELRQQHAAAISKSSTFTPHGISEREALDYLKTDEGAMYYWRVAEAAEPGLRPDQIQDRVIGQIQSGLELPRMDTIGTDDVLVKFVAEGFHPSEFSPYWAREAAANAGIAAGENISQFYGLPVGSEAPRYGMYRMTPKVTTQVFTNTVAPTSELGGLVTKSGGAEQVLVPNRQLFNEPTLVRFVDNTPAVATEVERGFSLDAVRGLAALGAAAVVYDATASASRSTELRSQGNRVGAESEIMHFGGRNLGALGGAALGAETLGALGVESGPLDLLVAGVGGIGGAIGGDKLLDAYDQHRIYNQTDPQDVAWTYDPARPRQGWIREVATGEVAPSHAMLGFGGLPVPVMRTVRADHALADHLSFQASTVAVGLALARPPEPRDPYTQPAAPNDTPSRIAAPWKRDAQTQRWTRTVTDHLLEHGLAVTHVEPASAQRAAQLNEAARQTIETNLASSPRAMAERYQETYAQRGWDEYGAVPEAVTHALNAPSNTLRASDGHDYTRGKDGRWETPGTLWGTNAAEGTIRRELDATRRAAPYEGEHERDPAQSQTLRSFSDPGHPQHALFNKLHDMFPAGTSSERLHQATAACYMAGIRQPQHLSAMGTNDDAIHFGSTQLGGGYGRMDIANPAPSVTQTMQEIQHYDQQQARIMGQMQVQNAQPGLQAQPGGR